MGINMKRAMEMGKGGRGGSEVEGSSKPSTTNGRVGIAPMGFPYLPFQNISVFIKA